jgi:acyl carrier protein
MTLPAHGGIRQELSDMWSDVLNRPSGSGPVGAGDRFFDVGGDSVAAIILHTTIEERLGTEVDPATVLDALASGTFESLVDVVTGAVPDRPRPLDPAAERRGHPE